MPVLDIDLVPRTEVPRTEVPRTEVPSTEVPSTEAPSGAGETAIVAGAGAIYNAIVAATGVTPVRLPVRLPAPVALQTRRAS